MSMISKDILEDIISAAGFAPSGDNSRPWRFVLRGDIVFQYSLANKDNPFLNYKHGGTLLANGAALENIVLAARAHGYQSIIAYFPDTRDPLCVAKIMFRESEEKIIFTEENIRTRHTNRRPYAAKPLDATTLADILSSTEGFDGVRVVLTEDQKEIKALGSAGSKAEIVILENMKLHGLLFGSVKWTKKEEDLERSGLYIKTLELDPVQEFFFKQCRRWGLMNFLNKIKFAHFIASQDAKNYGTGGAYIGVLMNEISAESFVKAGQVAERIWVLLNTRGYAAHPIVAALFLALRIRDGVVDGLAADHVQLMRDAAVAVDTVFKPKEEHVVFMLRAGSAPAPTARSQKNSPMVSYE